MAKVKDELGIGPRNARFTEDQLSKFEKGIIDAPDLSALLLGGVLPLQSAKLAMFKGTQPIDEVTYVNLVMKAYEEGKIPVEEGIYMQELRTLERQDPTKYDAWLRSGYKTTSFKGGANSAVNKEIQARGGLVASKYDQQYNFHSERGTLIYTQTPLIPNEANKKELFESAVRGFSKNTPLSTVSGTGKTFAVHFSNQSQQVLLEGRVRDQDGELVFNAGKNQNYEEYPVTIIPQITGQEVTGIAAEGDVGHVMAESTQGIKAALDRVKKALELEKQNTPQRTKVVSYLENLSKNVQEVYNAAVINDKIFFKTPIPTSSQELKTAFAIIQEQARILGHNQVLILEESSGGRFTTKVVEVPFNYSADIAVSEFRKPNQNWKGPRSLVLTNALKELLKGIAEARFAGNLTDQRSSSILTRAMLLNLDKAFNTKEFSRAARKSSGKKKKEIGVKIKKGKKKDGARLNQEERKLSSRVDREKKKLRQQINSTPIPYTRLGDRRKKQGTKINLVDALNMHIEEAVRDQMVQPSLINRTGRFARSVRVTAAEQNAIFYVYQKAPYSIFSVQEGRSPWATRFRDPHRIISNALNEVVYSKYAGYFKQPLRIIGA